MDYYGSNIQRLIEALKCLPGVGAKSAQRMAFHITAMPEEEVKALADAIVSARKNVRFCRICQTVTDDELCYARRYVASTLRTVSDSPAALESFYLPQTLGGWDWSPEELAALCEEVTKEQVVEIAQSLACDAVYFLRGAQTEEAAAE